MASSNVPILITGAAKRVGRAIAVQLAKSGHDLALTYHSSETAARGTADLIRESGRRCELFQANLADPEHIVPLFQDVLQAFPDLGGLINNAAIFTPSTLETPGTEILDKHLQVNFRTPYQLTKAFAEHCGSGVIINILDTAIVGQRPSHVDYHISKQALASLTRVAALDLAPEIRVNAVAPGPVLPPPGADQSHLDAKARELPLKRPGCPQDIADAVDYLLRAEFVHGHVLFVDGGAHLHQF